MDLRNRPRAHPTYKLSRSTQMIGYAIAAVASLLIFGKAFVDDKQRLAEISRAAEARQWRLETERRARVVEQRKARGRMAVDTSEASHNP